MDLVLLQPGDPEVFGGGANDTDNGGSPIDSAWQGRGLDLGPCIELLSMQYGMKQQVTADVSNSARTAGRPVISEITLVDRTSIRFHEYCLRAEPIGNGKDKPTRLQSHPNDMSTEQLKLNFTEVLWAYAAQDTVTSAAAVSKGWSIARSLRVEQFTE